MSSGRYVYVNVDRIARETEAAFLFLIDDEEVWVPKSQVPDADEYEEGDEGLEIAVTQWIAQEKGLQ